MQFVLPKIYHASSYPRSGFSTNRQIGAPGVISYCTKWATVKNVAADYRALLVDPDSFIKRIRDLKGVTRFFGELHFKQHRNITLRPQVAGVEENRRSKGLHDR
jgi:hypothetical protein